MFIIFLYIFFIFHFLFYVLYFILSTIKFICVRTIQILHSVSTGEDDVSLVAFIYRNSYSFVSKCTSPSALNNGKLAFLVLKFFNTENIFLLTSFLVCFIVCLFIYLFIYLFICLYLCLKKFIMIIITLNSDKSYNYDYNCKNDENSVCAITTLSCHSSIISSVVQVIFLVELHLQVTPLAL